MLNSWSNLYEESNVYSAIFSELVCIVSKYPKKIHTNDSFLLHNTDVAAIEWGNSTDITNWDCYYVNGRNISKDNFDKIKKQTYTIDDFFKETNEEIKSVCLQFMIELYGDSYIATFFSSVLKEVDTYVNKKDDKFLEGTTKGMNVGVYTLFKGELNDYSIAYVRCYCPSSDRMFYLGVEDKHNNAKDAIASLYTVPNKLKPHVKSISRQGERFSTTFTETGLKLAKNLNKQELADLVSLSGNEYFSKMQFEY